jgi:dolichol-phosphate mannosyltransferase
MPPGKISIILPCYNEAENLPLLIPEISKNIPEKYDYEIICIDDGSSDNTGEIISNLCEADHHIKGIFFYRNFGLQQALRAGIAKASGDAVVTMDADFQHPPEVIPQFIKLWEEGHDVVQALKQQDKTSSKQFLASRSLAYKFWNYISDGILIPGSSDFRLIDKRVAEYIRDCPESKIFLRGVVQLAAKDPAVIPFIVQPRKNGRSAFGFRDLMNIFLNGIISFSIKPLRFAWIIGLSVTFIASIYIVADLMYALLIKSAVISGYKTLVLLMLILNGIQIFFMGIIGEYIGVIFKETKHRPIYRIEKLINLK